MKIRRFYGKDMREALNQVKQELGGDAVIMSNKKVGDGVELVAAYDNDPVIKSSQSQPVTNIRPDEQMPKLRTAAANTGTKTPTLSEVIGESGSDSLKALLEKQYQANSVAASDSNAQAAAFPAAPETEAQPRDAYRPAKVARAVAGGQATVTPISAASEGRPTGQAEAGGKSDNNDSAITHIHQELKSLRDVLEFQISGLVKQERQRSHPLQSYLTTRLAEMGLSHSLAEEVVSYAPSEINERDAWLFVLKLLAKLAIMISLKEAVALH